MKKVIPNLMVILLLTSSTTLFASEANSSKQDTLEKAQH